jgi:hypothetical protein
MYQPRLVYLDDEFDYSASALHSDAAEAIEGEQWRRVWLCLLRAFGDFPIQDAKTAQRWQHPPRL